MNFLAHDFYHELISSYENFNFEDKVIIKNIIFRINNLADVLYDIRKNHKKFFNVIQFPDNIRNKFEKANVEHLDYLKHVLSNINLSCFDGIKIFKEKTQERENYYQEKSGNFKDLLPLKPNYSYSKNFICLFRKYYYNDLALSKIQYKILGCFLSEKDRINIIKNLDRKSSKIILKDSFRLVDIFLNKNIKQEIQDIISLILLRKIDIQNMRKKMEIYKWHKIDKKHCNVILASSLKIGKYDEKLLMSRFKARIKSSLILTNNINV